MITYPKSNSFKLVDLPARPIRFFTDSDLLLSSLSKKITSNGMLTPCSNVDVAKQILGPSSNQCRLLVVESFVV